MFAKSIKLFINAFFIIGAFASIYATKSWLGNKSWLLFIIPVVVAVITFFWELIIHSFRKRSKIAARIKTLKEDWKAAQKEAKDIAQEKDKIEAQIDDLEELHKKAQIEAQEKTREKVQIKAQMDALIKESEKDVQFYPGDPSKPSGLDSEEAISIIEGVDEEICVTHFISNEPSKRLLGVISELEKRKVFRRLVHFDKNLKDEYSRRRQYNWLSERIIHRGTENKYISGQPLPLDFLIVDTVTVLVELPNIVSDEPNLLVIKKEGAARAFKSLFLRVFNNTSKELTSELLENYFNTGEI